MKTSIKFKKLERKISKTTFTQMGNRKRYKKHVWVRFNPYVYSKMIQMIYNE